MKTKRTVSLFLAFVMLIGAFAGLNITAEAAQEGTTISNAIVLKEGVSHTKYWADDNLFSDCYNKIVVPARGVITFTITRPDNNKEDPGYYDFFMYSSKGSIKWHGTSYAMCKTSVKNFVFNIAVAAGTYYLNIKPYIWLNDTITTVEATYKYTFEANDYWEIEPNNAANQATSIALNTTYSGVYGEESYDYDYEDWYKVKLIKGKSYKLSIGNYEALEKGTTIFDIYDSDMNSIDIYYLFYSQAKKSGNTYYITFKAPASGTFYLRFENDGCSMPVKYTVNVSEAAAFTAVPTKLSVSQTTNSAKVSWNAASGATGYKVYLYKGSKCVAAKTTTSRSCTFTKLSKGTTYKVFVEAYKKSSGKVVSSKNRISLTFATKPGTPTLSVTAGAKNATLKWNKQTGATGYIVYMATSKSGKFSKIATLKGNSKISYTKTGLTKGKTYYFKVCAYTTAGGKSVNGAYSAVKSVKVK